MQPRAIAAACIAAPLLLIPACGEPAPPDPASDQAFGEADQTYTVRGEVVTTPSPGPPPQDLTIKHEHIPEFVGSDGTIHVNPGGVKGMRPMTMPFPLVEPGVDLSGLTPGDKIEFTFEVRWEDGVPAYRITTIEQLPPDTELDYSVPDPQAPTDAPSDG